MRDRDADDVRITSLQFRYSSNSRVWRSDFTDSSDWFEYAQFAAINFID